MTASACAFCQAVVIDGGLHRNYHQLEGEVPLDGTGLYDTDLPHTITATVDEALGYAWTGIHTFQGTKHFIVDEADATKRVRWDVGGTTGVDGVFATNFTTAKTISFPDATDTVGVLAASQAFTNKTYNGLTVTSTTGTLTIAATKTLTANNSLTLAGADATTITFQGTDTYIGRATTDQGANGIQNKDLSMANVKFVDPSDTTKKILFQASGAGTGTTLTLTSTIASGDRVLTFTDNAGATYVPTSAGALAITGTGTIGYALFLTGSGVADWQAVTGDVTANYTWTGTHSFQDTKFFIRDVTDGTKRLKFDVTGTTGIDGTFQTAFTTAKTITFPDVTSTVAVLGLAQTFTSTMGFTGGISVSTADMTIVDRNIILNTITGTKIGTATGQKLGFWNATPVVQPSAYTQTYSTADKTLSAYTSNPESDAYTGDAGGVATVSAAANVAKLSDLNALRTAYDNLRAFTEDLAGVVNSVVNDGRTIGLWG
jgi:hypothetical protein